jgi:tryptophan synthase alpha chain
LNRIKNLFKTLRREKRCGVIAYVTCGDPDLNTTVQTVLALEAAGVDAIELGIPFSDPIADGPVIQAAAQRALKFGTTTRDVLSVAREIRQRSRIPLIAFSYLNPVSRYGFEKFAADAAEAGFDSVLLTDLLPEDSETFRQALHARDLGLISLLAPTSSEKRVKLIDRASDGFIYYVSMTGVTGERRELDQSLVARLDDLRRRVKKPLAVGFGISQREHYEALRDHCDAVVIGSAIVRAMNAGPPAGAPERAAQVIRRLLGFAA